MSRLVQVLVMRRRFLFVFTALVLIAPTFLAADQIVRTDGRVLEGKIVEETAQRVTIQLKSGAKIAVNRPDISELHRDESMSPQESDGDTAFAQENYERALDLYEAALAISAEEPIRVRLAEKIEQARTAIRERDEETVRQQLVVFEDFLARRSYAKATEVLDQIEQRHASEPMFLEAVRRARARIHYSKARDARNAVNVPLAEREVKTALSMAPDFYEAQMLAAQIYYDRSEFLEALQHFLDARRYADTERQGTNAIDNLDYQIGVLLHQLGRYQEALPYFSRLRAEAAERFPRAVDYEIDSLSRLGDYYLFSGDLDNAIETYELAIASDPDNPILLPIRKRLGELFLAKIPAEPDRALEQFLIMQRDTMAIPDLFYLIARCYMQKGETESAIQALESEIRLNPANYNAYIDLATLYVDSGQYSRAEARLKAAIDANPDPYQADLILGRLRRLQKRYDEAKTLLNRVIAKDDSVIEASLLLGLVYLDEKEYVQSADLFERVIREYQEKENRTPAETRILGQALNARGQVDLERQQVRLALERFEKARQLDPTLAETYGFMGQAHRRLTNYPRAEELFKQAIDLAKNNPDYHLQLGLLYHNNLEQPEDAIEQYNKYFDLGGQDYVNVNKWLEELGAKPRNQDLATSDDGSDAADEPAVATDPEAGA
jgi:tetratricopeptide (TPR) repeat protein